MNITTPTTMPKTAMARPPASRLLAGMPASVTVLKLGSGMSASLADADVDVRRAARAASHGALAASVRSRAESGDDMKQPPRAAIAAARRGRLAAPRCDVEGFVAVREAKPLVGSVRRVVVE